MKKHNEKIYYHFFGLVRSIGPITLKKLLDKYGSIKSCYEIVTQSPNNLGGLLSETMIAEIIKIRDSLDLFKSYEELQEEEIDIIENSDKDFPKLLKEIHDTPPFLYYKGNKESLNPKLPLAVVGTRKPSAYGTLAVHRLTKDLVNAGATIISGLALGIDSIAHIQTIENKGSTIAVVGSGLDKDSIYPKQHWQLSEEIIKNGGAIISEYPPKTPSLKHHFPIRNRIISGICKGVIIIEAKESSGTLITAKHALEQNRDVFALPGSIFSETSIGPLNLITQGAIPITSSQTILSHYPSESVNIESSVTQENPLTPTEEKILKFFGDSIISIDELIKKTELTSNIILPSIAMLSLKGSITKIDDLHYAKRSQKSKPNLTRNQL